MKKIGKLIFLTFISWLITITIKAQLFPESATITASVIAPTQSGNHNYFGVRIELNQAYDQNITVEGYIFDLGSPNTNHPFSVTVPAGYLSEETALTFYETDPTAEGDISVSTISPLTVTSSSAYYSTQCSFITSNPSLKDFFMSYDTSILRDADTLQSTSYSTICDYMAGKNSDLIQYLNQKAPSTFTIADMDPEDDLVTVAGMIFLYLEDKDTANETAYKKYFNPNYLAISGPHTNFEIPYFGFWSCAGDILLDVIGIGSLYDDYQALINSGASWSTVRGVIWRMIKRTAGWWAAVYGTYRIIRDCL